MVIRFAAMFLLAGLLALSMPASAHESGPPGGKPGIAIDEQAMPAVAVVDRFSNALKTGDIPQAGSLLAEDVLILESGGAEHSRNEYLAGHAIHDAAFLKDARVQVTSRMAHADGTLAWVATESRIHASRDNASVDLSSTETMVLRKTGQGWRIVHIHWSSHGEKTSASVPGLSHIVRETRVCGCRAITA